LQYLQTLINLFNDVCILFEFEVINDNPPGSNCHLSITVLARI